MRNYTYMYNLASASIGRSENSDLMYTHSLRKFIPLASPNPGDSLCTALTSYILETVDLKRLVKTSELSAAWRRSTKARRRCE